MRAALIAAAVLLGLVLPLAGLVWSLCACSARSEPWWETTQSDIESLPTTSAPTTPDEPMP